MLKTNSKFRLNTHSVSGQHAAPTAISGVAMHGAITPPGTPIATFVIRPDPIRFLVRVVGVGRGYTFGAGMEEYARLL